MAQGPGMPGSPARNRARYQSTAQIPRRQPAWYHESCTRPSRHPLSIKTGSDRASCPPAPPSNGFGIQPADLMQTVPYRSPISRQRNGSIRAGGCQYRLPAIHGTRSPGIPFCPHPHFSQHLPHCRQFWPLGIGVLSLIGGNTHLAVVYKYADRARKIPENTQRAGPILPIRHIT